MIKAPINPRDLARFLRLVVEDMGTGCWVWQGSCDRGYGKFSAQRKTHRAHVWGYRAFRGEIAKGLMVDHTCRNRGCVNPWHGDLVTNQVNTIRGIEARRAAGTLPLPFRKAS